MLLKCMLDNEIVISQDFDWSLPKKAKEIPDAVIENTGHIKSKNIHQNE